jgi:uncharacterized membrane protein YesL
LATLGFAPWNVSYTTVIRRNSGSSEEHQTLSYSYKYFMQNFASVNLK